MADAGQKHGGNRKSGYLSAGGFFAVWHISSMGCVFSRAEATASSPQPASALLLRVWHGGQHGRLQVFATHFVPVLGAMWAQTGFSSPSAPLSQHCPTGQVSFQMTGASSTLLGFPHLIAPTSFRPASCPVIPALSIQIVPFIPALHTWTGFSPPKGTDGGFCPLNTVRFKLNTSKGIIADRRTATG